MMRQRNSPEREDPRAGGRRGVRGSRRAADRLAPGSGARPKAISLRQPVGWVGSAVLASATHLLPAIGPGDPVVHGRQRALLGRLVGARLVSLDLGVVAMSLGIPLGAQMVVLSGALLAGAALVATAVLLVRAVTLGMHGRISRVTDELERDHADR